MSTVAASRRPASARPTEGRLPLRTIALFSLPPFGAGYMFFLIILYLMKFATDVLLIAPAAMGTIFFVARTLREDRTLRDRLVGYREYQTRVRWRLLPGVW